MLKVFSFFTLLLLAPALHTLNIKKLELTSLPVHNQTTRGQTIEVLFQTEDGNETLEHTIAPQATALIENNECKILNITTDNTYVQIKPSDDGKRVSCQLSDTPSNDFPLALPLDLATSQDPGLKEIVTKTDSYTCRRFPKDVTPGMFFEKVSKLYEQNIKHLKQVDQKNTQEPRIPRIIHVIWFGEPLPVHYAQWHNEWKKQHKEWRIICWTEQLLAQEFPNGLKNQAMFNQAAYATNYAKMSDVARYEILEKFGGLYIDFDAQNFENFLPLNMAYDFYAGMEEVHGEMEVGNAVIGATPNHPIIKRCVELVSMYEKEEPDLSAWDTSFDRAYEVNHTLVTTGPVMLTRAIWEQAGINNNRDIIFPSLYIYCTARVHPASFCKHHFYDTWVADITC